MLGEVFRAKKQNQGVIKNQTKSLTKPERIFYSVGDKIKDEVQHLCDPFPLYIQAPVTSSPTFPHHHHRIEHLNAATPF
jgi:hypothetical protein